MLKKKVNRLSFDITIKPEGPVLVKSGYPTTTGPDMTFVRTWRDGEEQVFLPGPGLKGVIRSTLEKYIRTFKEDGVCLPYADKDGMHNGYREIQSCGRRIDSKAPTAQAYRESCPACRMFGSLAFSGRTRINDAYVAEDKHPALEVRDGVAIDRHSGGAAPRAKYDYEVAVGGLFSTTITLDNFEIWQAALLGLFLRDLTEGSVWIGMGTSRGLGKVSGTIKSVRYEAFSKDTVETLSGLETRLSSGECREYGIRDDMPMGPDITAFRTRDGLFQQFDIPGEEALRILNTELAPVADAFLGDVRWSPENSGGGR